MKLTREERLLHFPPITNIRDLGGYETKEKKFTKTHKYVRSAIVANIDEKQLQGIYDYGIRAVLDFRSEGEIESHPHALNGYKDVAYYSVNLMDIKNLNLFPEGINELSDMYIYLVDNCQHRIKEVFQYFLKHNDEGILFNCSAGKDRTGVIAALLLNLAEVEKETIIVDYSESYENNLSIVKFLENQSGTACDASLLLSEPEQIKKFLNHFESQHHSTYDYLLMLGFSEEEVECLKTKFVSDK